jgi:signal transduction histidine kinase
MINISKKRERYSHSTSDSLKEQRRVEGDLRKREWDGLTLDEKLEKLVQAGGESRKQVFKLTGQDVSAETALRLIRTEKNDA